MYISNKVVVAAVLGVLFVCFGTYQLLLGQLAKNAHEIGSLREELGLLQKELHHLRSSLHQSALSSTDIRVTKTVAVRPRLPLLLLRKAQFAAPPDKKEDEHIVPLPKATVVEEIPVTKNVSPIAPVANAFSGFTLWIVPHSHTDPGWHKTVEGYYKDQVQSILTSAMAALRDDPHRRFSWVEVCFFARWWRDQSTEMRDLVRRLYRDGQLEFVMGGWVSNDEATVTYIQSVQQMTEGHRWLQENVASDIVPRVAWQIDPFGLSNGMAYIFGEMGLDQEVSWRITEDELATFLSKKESEFVWEGHRDVGEDSRVLLHLLPHREYGYGVPLAFFFDTQSRIPNTDEKVADLARQLVQLLTNTATSSYPHKEVLWLWGFDFAFTNAGMQFGAMDRVINHINRNPDAFNVPGGVRARYATPSNYFDALRKFGPSGGFNLMQDKDFFPYQAGPVNYWTGYYTSRPHFKRACRHLDTLLRTADIGLALAQAVPVTALISDSYASLFGSLELARQNNGILQHHDAITGTMWQNVLDDYYQLYSHAASLCDDVAGTSVSAMLGVTSGRANLLTPKPPPQKYSKAVPSLEKGAQVAVTNSLGWQVTEWTCVEVPHKAGILAVETADGVEVPSQPLPLFKDNPTVPVISNEGYRLCFKAVVPAMGMCVYRLRETEQEQEVDLTMIGSTIDTTTLPKWVKGNSIATSPVTDAKNDLLKLTLDPHNNARITHLKDIETGKEWILEHDWFAYNTDTAWDNSYTFKSNGAATKLATTSTSGYILRGKFLTEIAHYDQVERNGPLRLVVKLWHGYRHLDIESSVEPPIVGHSLSTVSRWKSSLVSDLYFYTDNQGLLPMRRRYNPAVMPSGNYFPSVFSVTIRDEKNFEQGIDGELLLALDTSLGVTSPEGGMIEVMVHRRALQPGEAAMNDEVGFVYRSAVASRRHQVIYQTNYPLSIFLLPVGSSPKVSEVAPLTADIAPPLFIATLRPFNGTAGLLALQVAHAESSSTSQPKPFDPETLLSTHSYPIDWSLSRSLSLNQPLHSLRRRWPTKQDTDSQRAVMEREPHTTDIAGKVQPLHMRSWLLRLKPQSH